MLTYQWLQLNIVVGNNAPRGYTEIARLVVEVADNKPFQIILRACRQNVASEI